MTYFEQALSAPELHFKQLRQIEPLLLNGRVAIRRTAKAIECEVVRHGVHYLLYLPFVRESLRHIEQLEEVALDRSRGPLIRNRIHYNELTLVDSLGRRELFDVVLQEIPQGMPFNEALLHYKASDLHAALMRMKQRMDAIGFSHNNLRPSNVVVCTNGFLAPLRYWYAEWLDFAENDISQLEAPILRYRNEEAEARKASLTPSTDEALEESTTPTPHEGILRLCRCGRYGFVDCEGEQITPFVYSWASDFYEGRAVVARNNKMGAINNRGEKVIPVMYDTVEFDIETGLFSTTRNQYRYLIDYDGKQIRRSLIEQGE